MSAPENDHIDDDDDNDNDNDNDDNDDDDEIRAVAVHGCLHNPEMQQSRELNAAPTPIRENHHSNHHHRFHYCHHLSFMRIISMIMR